MSTGVLCNKEQNILGQRVFCTHWKDHKGDHQCHVNITDNHGNKLGAEIKWPNFIGKDLPNQ